MCRRNERPAQLERAGNNVFDRVSAGRVFMTMHLMMELALALCLPWFVACVTVRWLARDV